MSDYTFHTEQRKIHDLLPYKQNPRQMTVKQKERLEKSLRKFNLAEIPVVNTDNTIVAGHQRLAILKLLGRGDEMIDVRVPDKKLTEKDLQEYNIGSNLWTGEWDWDQLAGFEKDLLLDIGFEEKDLNIYFQLDVVEDEAPELPKEPKSKLGDLYQLGNHRLLCGDATKKEDVERLMDGQGGGQI